MPFVYGYGRVSHEDSSESGLGVEASLYSIATWWKYQREAGRFLPYLFHQAAYRSA